MYIYIISCLYLHMHTQVSKTKCMNHAHLCMYIKRYLFKLYYLHAVTINNGDDQHALGYHVCFLVVNILGHAWMFGSKIRWRARKWRSCSQQRKVPSNTWVRANSTKICIYVHLQKIYIHTQIYPYMNMQFSDSDMHINIKCWRQQNNGINSWVIHFFT